MAAKRTNIKYNTERQQKSETVGEGQRDALTIPDESGYKQYSIDFLGQNILQMQTVLAPLIANLL